MFIYLLLVTGGFVVLYFGADWMVKGATSMALNLNVSKVVVGLTLVAFGTSSPEFFVNMVAAYRGNTALALGNVAGSNLTNLCLGFGLCAVLGTLMITRERFFTDLLFFSLTPGLVVFTFVAYPGGYLPYGASPIFALLLVLYFWSVKNRIKVQEKNDTPKGKLILDILIFLTGCGMLYGGGELILYNSVKIAEYWRVSETIIGLTIVAGGTSIPDVTASVVAIRKKETAIAVGNLLGSNIFNILLVLGVTLVVSGQDLAANWWIALDYGTVCLTSMVFSLYALLSSRIHRVAGIAFILFYLAYLIVRVQLE
jgi:cation:H+ antiporter